MPVIGTKKSILKSGINVRVLNPEQLIHGQVIIAAAGTDKPLGVSQVLVVGVTVKALSTNTNSIWVGIEGVSNATGYELAANEQIFIPVNNISFVWIDVTTNGEGATFIGN